MATPPCSWWIISLNMICPYRFGMLYNIRRIMLDSLYTYCISQNSHCSEKISQSQTRRMKSRLGWVEVEDTMNGSTKSENNQLAELISIGGRNLSIIDYIELRYSGGESNHDSEQVCNDVSEISSSLLQWIQWKNETVFDWWQLDLQWKAYKLRY